MVVSADEAQTAVIHSVTVRVHRDVDDKAVMTAFWALVKKACPDKGGQIAHSQKLHAAKESWEKARESAKVQGEAQTKKERIPRRSTF